MLIGLSVGRYAYVFVIAEVGEEKAKRDVKLLIDL